MILGIDAGNEDTKVCGPFGISKFASAIGPYRERNLRQTFGEDDMEFEYEGRKGFAGTLVKFECDWVNTRKGDSKAHFEAKLRVLLAIHRYGDDKEYDIVVGQPISTHSPEQKQAIKKMLLGDHELTVNGSKKAFTIRQVEVAAEGGSASLADPKKGLVRIIDIGSGTVNFATLYDMRYVDRDSFTVSVGMATARNKNYADMAQGIANEALQRWKDSDYIRLVGGGAEVLYPYLKEYFPNCEVLTPKIQSAEMIQMVHPVYANAVGFYQIAVKIYG